MQRGDDDISGTAGIIVAAIYGNRESIFRRLREASPRLTDYNFLLRELPTLNVSTHRYYQKRYNSFYVVRRNREWRAHYYGLLQREKGNRKVTFDQIIRELHCLTRRVEASFSSKLVATIRPDLPVYDVMVCRHMNVDVPPQHGDPSVRIERLVGEYDRMVQVASESVKTNEFKELGKIFDKKFNGYSHFTDTKKAGSYALAIPMSPEC